MRPRTPWILWTAIFADLAKLVALSASILVIVVSLATAIKPLSDGYLSAADALRLIAILIPPGLAYALPFAAGFGATLVYHRIAADREALAAYAGGIGHRTLLTPALVAGIALMVAMVALTQEVIPRFLQSAQRVAAFNAARYIQAEIAKGRAVAFDQMQIFADQCLRLDPPPGSGATDVLRLERFAAVELGDAQAPITEVTASRAHLWLFPPVDGGDDPDRPGSPASASSRIIMRLERVVAVQEGRGVVGFEKVDLSWSVPNTFRDSPKYLPWSELVRLRDNPERMNWMEQRRVALAVALAQADTLDESVRTLNAGGTLRLIDDRGEAVVISGARATRDGETLRIVAATDAPIEVRLNRAPASTDSPSAGAGPQPARVATIVRAGRGNIATTLGPDARVPRFTATIQLQDATTSDASAPNIPGATLERFEAADLTFDLAAASAPLDQRIASLLTRTESLARGTDGRIESSPEPRVAAARHEVVRKLRDLEKDVLSKRNERMAMSASALVMVLTGAIAALRFSNRRVLGVYLWTFVPALASLVTIGGGSPMVGSFGTPGLILMWSGVVGLGVYTLIMYRGLRKH